MAAIYIETYGCQMNEYDSEIVRALLAREHRFCGRLEDADVALINTCAVRESAHNKIHARVGDLTHERRSRGLVVGLLGCMAQNLKDELLSRGKVDFIAGPDSYRKLPGLVAAALKGGESPAAAVELSEYETYADIVPERREGVNAWIAVMRGCDNFCSFCVVPFTRGRERSRELKSVVAEARACVAGGYRQVTLLGQNVNSYRDGAHDFADLLEAVSAVPDLPRIRFTSPHPQDFPLRLLRVIAARPNLCKHVHLPLQAGNDAVLRRMNRGYTRAQYLDIARAVRAEIPGVFLTTDIITGFPGETASEFADTLAVMEELRFESAYIFKYSQRVGTLAARRYSDDVSDEEKSRRTVLLNDLQHRHTRAALERQVGRSVEVLIEDERTPLSDGQCQGRMDQGVTVVLPQDGTLRRGELVKVEIRGCTSHVLLGEPARVPACV